MKTVKELYEELNRVVVNKLLSNEYTFVSQTTSVVRLKIDNLPFTFWTGYYGTYFSSYGDFGESNVLDVKFTEEEEKKMIRRFMKTEDDRKKKRIAELQKEIDELKK